LSETAKGLGLTAPTFLALADEVIECEGQLAAMLRCLLWVKGRNTHNEQMWSAVPSKAAEAARPMPTMLFTKPGNAADALAG
jgi:hypothetical protein